MFLMRHNQDPPQTNFAAERVSKQKTTTSQFRICLFSLLKGTLLFGAHQLQVVLQRYFLLMVAGG